ncbi:flagellin [Ammoniphilus resinae]|uniref:Flagellin n=1 Tax=Ammoniphilus resinae TaxID=861532 RepID=A0ABS4GMF5_9BACL|nr:flagellin [Ammoniphilus resinae]MBP1931458.1 flagellin [Ammoniphilus resinae]
MRINHNIAALNTYRQLTTNNAAQGKSIEKLSSGLRINRAGDDAAGLAISEKMRGQIRGLDQATRNSQDAISMIQTAEGALNETHSILQRMRELAVQSSTDTNTLSDREEIQKEINQLTSEINRIGNTTDFNTKKLLNGDLENTFTSEVTGMNFVGGTATSTNVSSTGLDVTLLSGTNALEAGEHTLEITSTRNTRDPQVLTATFNDFDASSTGNGKGVTFDGNQITADNTTAAENWTLTYVAADDAFTVTNAAGTFSDTVKVGEQYDAHGVSFKITDAGTIGDGETLVFATTAGADTIGTEQTGWTTVNSQDAVIGDITLTDDGTNEISQYAGGKLTITVNGSAGNYNVLLEDKDGNTVINDTVTGTGTFNDHGINFNLSNLGTTDGNVIELDLTEDTYTVQASLDGGAAQTLTSTYDGVSTSEVTDFTGLAGIELDSSAVLAAGTHTFDVEQTVVENGTDESATFQIGANQNQSMSLSFSDMRASALGITGTGTGFSSSNNVTDGTNNANVEKALDVTTTTNASNAITVIDDAIKSVSAERSKLGASQNRLEHTINNLGTSSENLTAAESRIRDVDMAKEMMEQTKNSILAQAAQAMLAQANQQPQGVLQLLR